MRKFFCWPVFKFFFLPFSLLSLLFLSQKVSAQTNLFVDDFNNPSLSKTKWMISGPQLYNGDGTKANWRFENRAYGISIVNRGFQFNETVPTNEQWNSSWKDYIFEVDFKLVLGVDTNLVFRYIDHDKWYGIHGIINENRLVLQKVGQPWHTIPPERAFAFQYNVFYRITVEVVGENMNISIKNNDTDVETLLWNISDPGTIITYGKPGLQAGTGASTTTEVWFDNVRVTSLETEKAPVVFIPGILSSWDICLLKGCESNNWILNPLAYSLVYRNLIKSFLYAGYIENQDFYVFNYDWRKPVSQTAVNFGNFIQTINVPKINVVGHSMGGLIARTYLQNNLINKVDKLITVGSPHQGSVKAYAAWEGGEFWDFEPEVQLFLDFFLYVSKRSDEKAGNTIKRISPSVKDLLPTFDFLVDANTNQLKDVWTQKQKNDFLKALNNSLTDQTKNLLETVNGNNIKTLEKIRVQSILPFPAPWWDQGMGLWEDGKPACTTKKTFYNDCPEAIISSNLGDGTVLLKSAAISGVPSYEYNFEHKELLMKKEGLEKIFEILGVDSPVIFDPLAEITNVILFYLKSPAHFVVTDPEGKKIGYQVSDGDLIEGAFYDEEAKLIIIPQPKVGNYNVEVEGEDSGTFHLLVGQNQDGKTNFHEFTDQTQNGLKQNYQFDFSQLIEENLVDPGGANYLESAKQRLLLLKPTLNFKHQKIVDQVLKDFNKILVEIGKHNYKKAANYLKNDLAKIYQLRSGLDLTKKEELEKISLDCQSAYWELIIAGNLKTTKAGADSRLKLSKKEIEVLNKYLEKKVEKRTKEVAFVFTLALEYLEKASLAFEEANHNKALIYSSIVKYLVTEIWVMVK